MQILILVACFAVALILVRGLWNLMQNGPGNTSQKLMRLRVIAQAVAVIIMTDLASVEMAADAVRVGALDYLFKPFQDVGLVVSTVRRALHKQQTQNELRHTTEELRKSEQLYRLLTEK